MSDKTNDTAKQRDYEVGDGKPPKECQWPKGVSGNPKGPPKAKTQLHRYVCMYLDMTDKQLVKLKKRKTLTQAMQAALKIVEDIKAGKHSGGGRMTRYFIDRDEGKAQENVKVTGETPLSDAECEEIREVLKKRGK